MKAHRSEGFRLSPQQDRLWRLMEAGGPFAAICAVRIDGELDAQSLRHSLTRLAARHSILRTLFQSSPPNSFPVQIVYEGLQSAWQIVDWTRLSPKHQQMHLQDLLRFLRRRPFDLAQDPPLEARLIALSRHRHTLLLRLSALCSDAWSLRNLLGQIFNRPADSEGEEPIDYFKFAHWQHELRQGELASQAEEFWQRRWRDASAARIPLRQSDASRDFDVLVQARRLSGSRAQLLARFSRQAKISQKALLLAAWQILLWRLSEHSEVIIGTAFDGREFEVMRASLGLYSRWFPVANRLTASLPFESLAGKIDRFLEEAAEWQSYDPPGQESEQAAKLRFALGFEFEEKRFGEAAGAGSAWRLIHQFCCTEPFELKLVCAWQDDDRHTEIHHDPARYRIEDAARLGRWFGALLDSALRTPQEQIARLRLMEHEEIHQLVVEWGQAASKLPQHPLVHELFEEHAARRPDALALVGSSHLSYAVLQRRSRLLARYLQGRGVGPEKTVGILMQRSEEMLGAVLAVVRAGGAYLPLDPAYPSDRLAFMLEDAGSLCLLTQPDLLEGLPALAPLAVCPQQNWAEIAACHDQEWVPPAVDSRNLAYLIYTSGSTGRPKGVTVSHGSLLNLVEWHRRQYLLSPHDRASQLAGVGFDASVWEVWPYWASGASLLIASQETRLSPQGLRDWLQAEQLTISFVPTPLMEGLLLLGWGEGEGRNRKGRREEVRRSRRSERGAEKRAALRVALTGGDRLMHSPPEALPFELVNHYGPAESTVVSTAGRVVPGQEGPPPIGRPIANLEVLVMDRWGNPLPAGIAGQLLVGGRGLARGYAASARQTAELFRPHPFRRGQRLYHSGDRVRWRGDGQLEFLGRIDQQIKIRGFRIELAEIEAVLAQHPLLQACAVLALEERPGEPRLVAFAADPDGLTSPAELQGFLREQLPEFMLPSAVVLLPELPLTANGKVDRRALPRQAAQQDSLEYIPPLTASQELLASFFADVLELERVGIQDSFFERGGHSLLATQVISRLNKAFGIDLPVRILFESPTVEELAQVADQHRRQRRGGAPALRRRSRGTIHPLSFAQQRLWFISRLEGPLAAYNTPSAARLRGPLDAEALQRALSEIVRRHEVLRTTFALVDGQPRQFVQPAAALPLPLLDLSALGEKRRLAEAERLAGAEARRPFSLEKDWMLRASLLQLGKEDHGLLLTMHHIVSDAWSMGILTRELTTLYQFAVRSSQFAAGKPERRHLESANRELPTANRELSLPPLPLQYADFAAWQREWLQGEVLQRQMDYWRGQLEGLPSLDLPTDRPRPPTRSYRGGQVGFALDANRMNRLRRLAREAEATPFMAFLTAFAALLHRYQGQTDLAIGVPIANRNQEGIEVLIGFFVNTLVMRLDLSGDPSGLDALQRVRKACLDAYDHQDVPFEQIVEELHPERDLAKNPLIQMTLAYQNAPQGRLELEGLELEPLGAAIELARFDLEGHLFEAAGGLRASLIFSRDLFDSTTVRRLVLHLETLLDGMSACPQQLVSQLPWLSGSERHQVLHAFNDTDSAFPRHATIDQLFEKQADGRPDAVAVVAELVVSCQLSVVSSEREAGNRKPETGRGKKGTRPAYSTPGSGTYSLQPTAYSLPAQLSYAELDRRSNQLACHLRGLGVGAEVLAGICLERGPEMVLGLLGILKAGGAYLPLDPKDPAERQAQLLEDAFAPVLLAGAQQSERLPTMMAQLVPLGSSWEDFEGYPGEGPLGAPASLRASESLAYVLYTSGSTGRPKGVAVSHRAVVRLVVETDYASFGPDEVFLQLAPLAFDASTLELWGSLLHGARLALMPPEVPTLQQLGRAIRRQQVGTLWLTAGLFQLMVQEELQSLSGVRQLLAGGDVLPVESVRKVLDELPGTLLINGYGPTENTTFSCCCPLSPNGGGLGKILGTVPIGRPIAASRAYLLDGWLSPVPVGVSGELCAAGEGLARGYWGRAWLTAERFVPDPISPHPGGRLYRTGDRARWLADGRIEFLGRSDDQVKVRGFRVELGEVQAALESIPGVAEAVAVSRQEPSGQRRLIAYAVPEAREADRQLPSGESSQKHVGDWQRLYEDLYRQPAADEQLNLAGWNSSYTGQPIPEQQMLEWLEGTVGGIRSLHPQRILEIGCGTGLLLARLAPDCQEYWATDFSHQAVRQIDRLKAGRPELQSVEVRQQAADDFRGIPAGCFDTVILNSVVQYFPGAGYLLEVIEGALRCLCPGGLLFVGDVRSLPLQRAYHASVELFQASASATLAELTRRVEQRLSREEELLLDPALFIALAEKYPQIASVEVRPQRGQHANELTRFRYEAILRTLDKDLQQSDGLPQVEWLDWQADSLTLEEVRRRLEKGTPNLLGVRGIPNLRLWEENETLAWLSRASDSETVGQLRRRLARAEKQGVDPEQLWGWGREVSCQVHLSWASSSPQGRFDALFCRDPLPDGAAARLLSVPQPKRPWVAYASNPLQERLARQLAPRWRQALEERLPDYMVPSAVVVLSRLPLTPSGKVDRRALPEPQESAQTESYRPPRRPSEELLAGIWAEVLGLERVGVDDNFFDLGGHSLLATQVITRIGHAFSLDLPLRTLFEAPTVAGLASRIEEQLQQGEGASLPPLVRVSREGQLPLSFAQQRLWFLDQLEPGQPIYNMPVFLRLEGDLNIPALQAALTEILRRHEALRTCFPQQSGVPIQQIHPPAPFPLPLIDLRGLPEECCDSEGQRLAQQEARRAFDLSRGPVIRGTLMLLGEKGGVQGPKSKIQSLDSGASQPHSLTASQSSPSSCLLPPASCLLLNIHHIVSDGWSMGVLAREMTALYQFAVRSSQFAVWGGEGEDLESESENCELRTANCEPPLPPLPIQYADFAAWQRAWLTGGVVEEQLGFWKEQLKDAAPLELPSDRPRPVLPSYRGATLVFAWPAALQESLQRLSRSQDATLFMTLLAGLAGLLGRCCAQDDISLGSPIANRRRAETEELIGFFVNTLVLRCDLSGDPPFDEFLGRVRETALGAYAHQDIPFEQVVEAVDPERSLSRAPLFQVMFGLENAPEAALEMPGLKVSALGTGVPAARFDLTISLAETGQGLQGVVEYSLDLFEKPTVVRLMNRWRRLLEAAAGVPETRLSALPLMGKAEAFQLLREWNPQSEGMVEEGIWQRFERQAAEVPDALGVVGEWRTVDGERRTVGGEIQLSYNQIERSSALIAGWLEGRGVGFESIAGVLAGRSPQTVLGWLGALRAGGAYLPLDPTHPPQRLAYQLQDSGAVAVLAEGPHEALSEVSLPVLRLDAALPAAAAPLERPIDPDQLAHVIYTSGSTGRPKGVAVSQRAVLRLFSQPNYVQLRAGDCLSQASNTAFDVAAFEIWGALLHGARLALIPRRALLDPVELSACLQRHRAGTVNLTPAVFNRVVAEVPGAFQNVADLMLAGEALDPASVRTALQQGAPSRLLNVYGPTECATFATWQQVDEVPEGALSIPIGRPIAHTEAYVLDRNLRPAPLGIPGELHLGGIGLARAYLKSPALTAEKFVPHAFSESVGQRLYRTGDRAVWRPQGVLDFLGRLDHQVKIRGFRIELGEIEATLERDPEVGQAVVLELDGRLVGFVTGRGKGEGEEGRNRRERGGRAQREGARIAKIAEKSSLRPLRLPSASSAVQSPRLQRILTAHLPHYMIPSPIIELDALPLTPNGKVDRRALAGTSALQAPAPGLQPLSPTEELLASIWSGLLQAENIGPQQSFFECGGHSLLATQLVSRIRDSFQVELPLRTVFEAPTLAAQARRIEEVRRRSIAPAPPLKPVARTGNLPLSFAQQRLWFLQQLDPQSPAYNIFTAFPLPEGLDVAALQTAFGALVRRHETLRTRFPSQDGQPVQVIDEAKPFPIPVIDLSGLGNSQKEFRRLRAEEALRPFDLAQGPLLRARLVVMGREEETGNREPETGRGIPRTSQSSSHSAGLRSPVSGLRPSVLLLTLHHIISDAWSMGILQREITSQYLSQKPGTRNLEPGTVPPLPIQYADFAVWQRNWLTGQVLRDQLNYWQRQLQGSPPLELPTDRPRPVRLSFRGDAVRFAWPSHLLQRLRELSRACGTTLFMTLAAAFQALLGRYCSQDDVGLGTPIANRNRSETEGLIGFFVNTLVLRADLSAQPSFRGLLEQLRETALDAYSHQDLPFEQLVEALHPERSLSRSPLFQVMFVLHNAAQQESAAEEAVPESAGGAVTSRFDLTLTLTEGAGLSGAALYSTDLFDRSSIGRLLRHFKALLETVAEDATQSVQSLALLNSSERQQAFIEWNDSPCSSHRAEPAGMRALPVAFAVQVAKRPDAVALVSESDAQIHLSYADLDRLAGKTASALQAAGVRPDALVAIFAQRSLGMVIGLLGILRAGAAYLPLDPAYPVGRWGVMLDDARPAALLIQDRLRNRLDGAFQPQQLVLERLLTEEEAPHRAIRISPEQMAYVMYTSGSTGVPKGVAVTHRAVAGLVVGNNYARLDAHQVFLQMATISFDASTFQIWGCLLNGARLVLYPPRRPTLEELQRVLVRQGITMLGLPAALFRLMVDHSLEVLARVPQVLSGGDVLSASHARRALQAGLGRLINAYGPTENTTYTCCNVMQAPPRGAAVPIGRPVAGSQVYVFDRLGTPVPLGVAGELFAGGEGLARGYLGRPRWTAERFVPNPFAVGERLYRTGDQVRWSRDGCIEFLGRLDHQCKIRGYRVEPAEIEAALCQHPDVRQAVVLVQGEAGDRSLAAFVTRGPRTDAKGCREISRKDFVSFGGLSLLPEYMIPARIFELDELPLTPNGKVDRRVLLAQIPAAAGSQPPASSPQPQSPTSELIAGIWAEVLQLDQVSLESSFFDLGGHSLLATQAISRIRRALGVELPLRAIFEAPTPSQMARRVEEDRLLRSAPAPPPMRRIPRDCPLPLSFAQQRLWFLDQLAPGSPLYNIPSAIRLRGDLDVNALEAAFNAVRYRHESLRTSFPMVDGKAVQSIHPWRPVPLPLVDLSSLPPEARRHELQRLANHEAQRPFDLQTGPLLRVTLVVLKSLSSCLLLTLHHIISDAWSSGILTAELSQFADGGQFAVRSSQFAVGKAEREDLESESENCELRTANRELSSGCELRTANRELALPRPLPLQYADYAVWQREWMQGGELKRQMEFWKQRLAGAPVLDLPTDNPRPAAPTLRGSALSFAWPEKLSADVRRLARSRDATLFMTLLTAFQALLSRLSGQIDISVGTPIANRHREETEGLIGFFVNTLVIRSDLSGRPSFAQMLAQVRESTLDAYAHQDFPFEHLVETLQPQRSLNRTPLFQVMFVLQNTPSRGGGGLTGIETEPIAVQPSTAKFDLTLSISEADSLWGTAEYSTDIFEATTIRRLISHLQILLESAVADPHQRIGQLQILSPAQEHQLLREWSRRADTRTGADTFIGILEGTVKRCPEAISAVATCQLSVVSPEPGTSASRSYSLHLSYRELYRRGDCLAGYLAEKGIGPESVLGILAGHCVEMLVGIVGALRAGAAYLPLATDYPLERLLYLLEDSGAVMVLTQQSLSSRLQECEQPICQLDSEWGSIEAFQGRFPIQAPVVPQSLAYVIYTSGSTGFPKGAAIVQRGLPPLAAAWKEICAMRESSRMLQFASWSFDASVAEVATVWEAGAVLVFLPQADRILDAGFWPRLGQHQITHVTLPPSGITAMQPNKPPSLETLVTAGEACPERLVKQWAPLCRLINGYGPTEVTIGASMHRCSVESPQPFIGSPVADMEAFLLNAQGVPVAAGVAGELCIAGLGLARGYVNRPALTARSFVPHPFSPDPGRRLYRSGDLVRWQVDGVLDFLGRIDDQVKVRGYRIEPAEVEAALLRHPAVSMAAVLARPDSQGIKSLVAYVGSAWNPLPDPPELSGFLGEELPEYMVPSAFVISESLPLTPSGKIDRKALLARKFERADPPKGPPPRDASEWTMARIWQDLLEVDDVRVNDNFFRLGGHSLLAVQLMNRIEKATGCKLPLEALFQDASLQNLARLVRQQGSVPASSLLALKPQGRRAPLVLVHPAGGSAFGYLPLSRCLDADLPLYAFQSPELESEPERPPSDQVEKIADAYLPELRTFQPNGPYFLGGHSLGGLVAFEMARRLAQEGQEIALLALIDTPPPGQYRSDSRDPFVLAATLGRQLGLSPQLLQGQDDPLEALLQAGRRSGTTSPDMDLERLKALYKLLEAHSRAVRHYRPPSAPLSVQLLRAQQTPDWEDAPWNEFALGGVEVHSIPGDHFSMLQQSNVKEAARVLEQLVSRQDAKSAK